MICHACGASTPQRASRGPLTVQLDPPRATWRGLPLRLNKTHIAMLHMLCIRPELSHFGMQIVAAGADASAETAKVQITHLRKRLPEGVTIEAIFGWGYRLVVDGE